MDICLLLMVASHRTERLMTVCGNRVSVSETTLAAETTQPILGSASPHHTVCISV